MNIKNDSNLKSKFTLYFIIFVILIFVVLWVLQVVFLQAFFKGMIKSELIKVGNTIKQSIENQDKLDQISFRNSFSILIVNNYGEVQYASNTTSKPFYIDLGQAVSNLQNSSKDYATYVINISRLQSSIVVYISELNGKYIIVSTNIEPMNATSKVLSIQLVYITGILLLISIIIASKIAKKLARPIEDITKKAKELGEGNYDLSFEQDYGYTEINNLAKTLNYSAQELKKTDDLRKELIANVSHDIRTPLTIIKAYSEMIKDLSGDVKEKRDEHLDIIINQADLLSKLTDDMMDLSKLETGIVNLNLEEYDIKAQIEELIKGYKCFNEYKFEFNYDNLEKYNVIADKIKISQVINNLVSNAINFVGKDRTVFIKLENYDESYLKITIKDNGIGMDDTSHIFDRYYKSNDKYRKSGFGTGLGLSIVKNILNLHQFKYGVNSKKDYGTEFFFYVKKSESKIKNRVN